MKVLDGNWHAFLARTLVFGVVVFGAVKLAVADPGGPASPNALTYSGVLRNRAGTAPISGDVTLQFTLRREDGVSCPPVMTSAIASVGGAFSAQVSTVGCPSGFFNGARIDYDVSLIVPSGEAGSLTPDGGVAVTPVPYSRFSDQAGVAGVAERMRGLQFVYADITIDEALPVGAAPRWIGSGVSSITHVAAGRWRVVFSSRFGPALYGTGISASRPDWQPSWAMNDNSSIEVRLTTTSVVDGGIDWHYISSGSSEVSFVAVGTPAP